MEQVLVKNNETKYMNMMRMEFDAVSENEGLARMAVASFMSSLNPTLEEISDVKTAVSEAVTNAIIHGYGNIEGYNHPGHGQMPAHHIRHPFPGKVRVLCGINKDVLHIEVEDDGVGIADVKKAMEPLYTTKPELDRSGMGFAFMEAFMDDLEVLSELGRGTTIKMKKKCGITPWIELEDEE